MSDKADITSGESEDSPRESSVDQKISSSGADQAAVLGIIDSLLPDAENVSLDAVIAAKKNLLHQRQLLVQSSRTVKNESEEYAERQKSVLKAARLKCEDITSATRDRLLLEDSDFRKISDALQATSTDSRRAIYFITLWLIKRLDQKLEKLFALTSPAPAKQANNGSAMIWDDRVALGTYLELLDIATSIQSSACKNLVAAVTATAEHWFKQLLERFSRDFASRLEAIHYPFSTAMQPVPKNFTKSPLPSQLEPLIESVKLLLELRPPPNWKPAETLATSTFAAEFLSKEEPNNFGEILIAELTAPMARRFRFHFYGKRPTNSPDHPEWYHTHILSWFESNGAFVRALFLDACSGMNVEKQQRNENVDILYNSWASVLVRLAAEKLSLDLPALLDSDAIFAHLIDETMLFRHSLFAFLAKQNATRVNIDPLRILVSSAVFDRWLDVEKRFALTRIDAFLSKSDALSISEKAIADTPSAKEIALAPTCVVDFVSLISGLIDRCDVIMSVNTEDANSNTGSSEKPPPPFCQFLMMILGLVDGFRIRLLQLGRSSDPLSSRGLALLAAAGHLEDALHVDWLNRPVVVACQALAAVTPISSPVKHDQPLIESPLTIPPASAVKRMIGGMDMQMPASAASDFTDEAALFARAVRELAGDVVGRLETELSKACDCAAEDYARGEQITEEQSSHVVITVAHCAAIALHNLLDRLRLGLGGSSSLRRLVGAKLAARVDAVLFVQIFERVASRKTVLAQVIAKELDEFVRTRIVYLLGRHLSPTTQPIADRILPRVMDSLQLLTTVPEAVARLLRSTLSTSGTPQAEVVSSLEEVGCRTFAKSSDGARLALLVLNIRFGAAV